MKSMGFKDQFGLKLGVEPDGRRREEEKRRGRERGDQAKIKAKKVWMLGFWYGTTWTFNALNGSPCLYSH